jgi:hypothetical protein
VRVDAGVERFDEIFNLRVGLWGYVGNTEIVDVYVDDI